MNSELEFGEGTGRYPSIFAAPADWVRASSGSGINNAYKFYTTGKGFFYVNWQINATKQNYDSDMRTIQLHVEAPNYDTDPTLNQLKLQVVNALLESNARTVVEEIGFAFKRGRYVGEESVQNNRATTAFKVILPADQFESDAEDNITSVHNSIGPVVSSVVQQFSLRLDQCFRGRK